jgi:3-hydroxybutyrate dehydrogenase
LIVKDKYFHRKNVAVVTGASSGVGRATAVALAVNGLTVVGMDIAEEGGNETAKMAAKLGGKVVFIKGDLTKDEEIEEGVRQAAQCGSIKFLANIAGIQHIDSIDNFPMSTYDLMMNIMLRAPFYLSKLCIPHIKRVKMASVPLGTCALFTAIWLPKISPSITSQNLAFGDWLNPLLLKEKVRSEASVSVSVLLGLR